MQLSKNLKDLKALGIIFIGLVPLGLYMEFVLDIVVHEQYNFLEWLGFILCLGFYGILMHRSMKILGENKCP